MKLFIATLIVFASTSSFARSIECLKQGASPASALRQTIKFQDADLATVVFAVGEAKGSDNKSYKCTTTIDGLGVIRSVSCDRWDDESFVRSSEVRVNKTADGSYSFAMRQYETLRSDTGVSDKNLVEEHVAKNLVCSVK